MPMLNLYSKNRRMLDEQGSEVTGHDRFGRRGFHSSAPTFASSPKWRQRKEAELRQKRRQLERRQSSVSYPPTTNKRQYSDGAMDAANGSCGNIYIRRDQPAETVDDGSSSTSAVPLGLEWICRRLQHLLCLNNQSNDVQLMDTNLLAR